jgi:ribulose-5-phosphate 4-epimerase/fuculose-1-phosphate aldolase
MATKKTSAELAREEAEANQLDSMLGVAFGDVSDIEKPDSAVEDVSEDVVEESASPSGPPSGPPGGPPSGPPAKSPSGPPSGPPGGPPSGPPAKSPSGPPSGPPGGPPSGPPSQNEEVVEEEAEPAEEEVVEEPEVVEEEAEPAEEEVVEEPEVVEEEAAPAEEETVEEPEVVEEEPVVIVKEPVVETNSAETEQEVARLNAEIARLRRSMAGAAEVIEEMEAPPMPPAVLEEIVVPAFIVGDFARLARQLDRELLIRANMGAIAMLHPDQPGVMISTKHMTLLPRLDERGLCAAKLGSGAPRGAPEEWRILEVLLASVSLVTGGPAAVIHSFGAYTTAMGCEKDLILVQPIDEVGKKQIGKIIIVDPDDDNPENFLRQVAEALKQGGMRCVVIRGNGAYAVGADLDQAWANAAMLEHSMRIVMLTRQANFKV